MGTQRPKPKKLALRQQVFDSTLSGKSGYRRPGSNKK